MSERSKWLACVLGGAAVGLLAACSTPTAAPGAQAAAETRPAGSKGEREAITGSRIPGKITDRSVRTIGRDEAVEMERTRITPGPPSN